MQKRADKERIDARNGSKHVHGDFAAQEFSDRINAVIPAFLDIGQDLIGRHFIKQVVVQMKDARFQGTDPL